MELLKQHNLEALKVAREGYENEYGSEGAQGSDGHHDGMSVAEDRQCGQPCASSVLVHDASTAAAAAVAAVRAAQEAVPADDADEAVFYDAPLMMPSMLSDPGPGRPGRQ